MSAALTSDQREVIERQQFQPLPEPERQWVKNLQDLLLAPVTPLPDRATRSMRKEWEEIEEAQRAQMHVEKEHVQFTVGDFGTLFEMAPVDPLFSEEINEHIGPISDKIVGTYFDCIMRYKNEQYHESVLREFEAKHPRRNNKKAKKSAEDRGGSSKSRKRPAPDSEGSDDSDDSAPPEGSHRKVAYIPNETFTEALDGRKKLSKKGVTKKLDKILDEMDLTVENVQELDYLFLPIYESSLGHHILMGIVPKQGFAFIIDSCQWPRAKEDFPVKHLMVLALHLCPAGQEWPVYGKWDVLYDVDDDSLPCTKQGDAHNCGVLRAPI